MAPRPQFETEWAVARTVPIASILGVLRRGTGDPTFVSDETGVWWAAHTPQGNAVAHFRARSGSQGDVVRVRVWGEGASWFDGRVAQILGDEDDVSSFRAHHPQVDEAWRSPRHRDWRVVKTGLVIGALVPTILEQKVTGKQAFSAYRTLVRKFGQPAPLPADVAPSRNVAAMWVPPTARQWRNIPSWSWLQAGAEPWQSRTIMRALEVADRLEETAQMPISDAHRRLRSIPGIGIWTAAKVAQTAWGDADAPTFGDYHVAKQVGFALLGRDADDAEMAALLEPYRGHRYRAERLVLLTGGRRPRRGARMALPSHLPVARW